MPRPDFTPFADDLYEALLPLAYADPDGANWSLAHYIVSVSRQFDQVEELARDRPPMPGWAILMNPDTCPDYALTWLGQFVGVRPPTRLPGETDAAYYTRFRQAIEAKAGFQRGTVAAMRAAAQQTLTGNKEVKFLERDGGPYKLTIITRTGETPDAAATLAALMSQKPAGITLTHIVVPGLTFDELDALYTTFDQMDAANPTFDDLESAP